MSDLPPEYFVAPCFVLLPDEILATPEHLSDAALGWLLASMLGCKLPWSHWLVSATGHNLWRDERPEKVIYYIGRLTASRSNTLHVAS